MKKVFKIPVTYSILLFYKGMLSLIEIIGCDWIRDKEGNHKIFNN